MITIANPEKYRAGLYERLSNENIEVASGEVVVSKDDELESGSISTQKIFNERIKCLQKQIENEDSSVDINKLVKDFVELKEITRTMMFSLIDRIEVSEDKEITIYYKFNILNMRKLNDEEKIIIVIII